MHLYEVRTDEEAVDVLFAYIVTGCSIGLEGRRRMRSFSATTRAGRRSRRKLKAVLRECLEWHRTIGHSASSAPLAGSHEAVCVSVSKHIKSTLAGWFLSIVAGWIIELAVDAFVRWILSPESERYRGHQ